MDASGTRNYSASNPYNIYQIKENGVLKAQYYYDTLGKLIREDNFYTNQTVTYTYDTNNNILSKTVYAVTASTTLNGGTTYTYGYSDTLHPDRLTSYDGQSIIYNGIGNPLSYLGKTLTWNGYELSSLVAGGVTYSYEYNSDGLRLKKTASNGQMTEYLRAGTQLIRETSGNNTIWYLYGQNGLIGFEYNGTSYYYVTNLQGDVMRIVDANGNVVASYVYDSWGKIIGQTGSLASVNPIRYRGYYYDQETQLYYLNARYYDPETGRFISADIVAEGGNLYAYCQNDPINRSDESGYLSAFWKKALSVAAVVVATVAVVAVATVFCGPASPYIAGAAIGAGMEMLQQIVFQDKDLSTINYAKVGVSAASGALSAIPGLGWVGAGLISAGTNAAMTAIDGGSAADIARSAAIGFVTGAVINKLFSGGMCFVEGTAVLAASGAVAIEAIAIGDLVYAYDDQTGNVALKEVVQLFRNETYELTTVRTDDGQEIISTPGHKYYTLDRDWISAVELRVGDRLLNVNGIVVIVEWIQHEIFENPVVVYNFEVKDYHTYFVAESITSPQSEFVLVHNRNCNYSKTNSGKPSGLSFNDLPDSTSVRDVLKWQNGSVKSKFPGQYLNSTIGEVRLDAKIGKKAGQTALKLLKNLRFIK
jgi:RHS repeat-associated protein